VALSLMRTGRCHACWHVLNVLRTVQGQGLPASAACPLPVHVRGFAAFVVVSDSYRVAIFRIDRDFFADAETFGTKG
jgi:hypothetical protein